MSRSEVSISLMSFFFVISQSDVTNQDSIVIRLTQRKPANDLYTIHFFVYNSSMSEHSTNQPLQDSADWLRDDEERCRRILEVVERNSVIEGLPPFSEEFRQQLMEQLKAHSASVRHEAPHESNLS